jgi:hypothetical protein
MVERTMDAYVASHNGMGDSITMIGAIRFLSQFYKQVFFICNNHNFENVKSFFEKIENITVLPIETKNEFDSYKKIFCDNKDNQNIDLYIAGCTKQICGLTTIIRNPHILSNVPQHNSRYKLNFYNFIESFYIDMKLNLTVYCEYFHIPSTETSENMYNLIKNKKIIFFHSRTKDRILNMKHRISQFINNNEYIIVCPNENVYDKNHVNNNIGELFVNLPIINYIDVILNAYKIIVSDSCFACIVVPLMLTNKIPLEKVSIIERGNSRELKVV